MTLYYRAARLSRDSFVAALGASLIAEEMVLEAIYLYNLSDFYPNYCCEDGELLVGA